ncbi:hypothetical protein TcCL_NonESM06427 [Trypanosoma cruzi]|uniref:Uncharacterized protein n=1 Tax=Trypanosoma cruzi (strain CL Brener) TaxID=353153 RepID=Q4E460_TRYCC|nr:hypothetical protein Tc00.1047053504081.365 [Trypanosoma cruzi]EAN99576.1 hypothetical protein Tc00.1047053504081.365 [Trypanosoma cruzi]RNC43862.1 hypothetical protein TcCL_NonESM06427 [Trypanosoma cruzi]|eukprot:XP_821427.1 hypothetical protein [Trypanosoma cruzi strain CL Brener]
MPRSGQEDVNQPLAGRQGVAVLTSGIGSGGGRAQTRSQQHCSTADPRGQERGAAMPRVSQALGSGGHQAVSHGPLAAWRSHRGGHDCGPPACGALQHGAGCRCNTLGLLHSVRTDSCGTVTAAARAVPRCISNHVITAARGVPHAEVEASQSASRRTTVTFFPSWQHACLSRDAVLRPRSVGWQMVVRVHANRWTSSGRHAVRVAQSRRETRRCGR